MLLVDQIQMIPLILAMLCYYCDVLQVLQVDLTASACHQYPLQVLIVFFSRPL